MSFKTVNFEGNFGTTKVSFIIYLSQAMLIFHFLLKNVCKQQNQLTLNILKESDVLNG